MHKLLYAVMFIVCIGVVSGCSSTSRLLEPEPGWVFLAQGKANHLREKDKFTIDNREQFAAIKLYVYHRRVTVDQIKIQLVNGDIIIPSIQPVIDAGNRSRTIELSADGRQIENITLRYKSQGKLFSDKALIQIGGLRPDENRR